MIQTSFTAPDFKEFPVHSCSLHISLQTASEQER